MNWGSISTDPVHGFIFVNDMRLGLWIQMIPSQNKGGAASGGEALNTGMGAVPLKGTPYAVNKNRFLSVAGIPCQAPPFGTLTAIDMKTRQVAWQVPVGTVEDTGPLGIRMHLPIKIGLPTSAAPCRPRVAWCSSPAPRTSTCAPTTAATATKSGRLACQWAARAAR